MRPVCILELDSPSYPPTDEEKRQCGCRSCLRDLETGGEVAHRKLVQACLADEQTRYGVHPLDIMDA